MTINMDLAEAPMMDDPSMASELTVDNVAVNNPVSAADSPNLDGLQPQIIQQRQILSLMGVDIWVSRHRTTMSVDYDAIIENHIESPVSDQNSLGIQSAEQYKAIDARSKYENELQSTDFGNDEVIQSHSDHNSDIPKNPNNNTVHSPDSSSASVDNQAFIEKLNTVESVGNKDQPDHHKNQVQQLERPKPSAESMIKIAPFEIVGAQYRDWVILADLSHMSDESTMRLWQNLINALSLTTEQLSFPICQEIIDLESANASVAGFVFRIAKNNHSNIAALTPLPDGIDHEQLIRVPHLSEMLQDSRQKKQLWHLLTDD